MSTSDFTGRIVVGTDGSAAAKPAVDWAAQFAGMSKLPLVIMLVAPTVPTLSRSDLFNRMDYAESMVADVRRRSTQALNKEGQRVREAHPDLAVETLLLEDTASYALARASKTATFVIVGSRGHSAPVIARTLGGTSNAVAIHSRGPIVVVPEDVRLEADGPIVVGVDDSPESIEAIRLAVEFAHSSQRKLIAVHTWDAVPYLTSVLAGWTVDQSALGTGLEEMVKSLVSTQAAEYPDLEIEYVVEPGHPANVLVEMSEEASLIVLGSRGRGGFTGLLLGSTSHEVMRASRCPVLVTRAAH